MTEFTIENALTRAAQRHPDRLALIAESSSITYAELEQSALGLVRLLKEQGVKPGDTVVLLAPNSIGFVAAFFGSLMAGAVVSTLSPDSGPGELATMIAMCAPAAAVCVRRDADRDFAAELGPLLPSNAVWMEDPDQPPWAPLEDRSIIVERDPDAPALVAFTSGSTGVPKGAVHRAETLVHTGERYLIDVLNGEPATLLATLPLYHLGGMTLLLFPALYGGGTLVLLERFGVQQFIGAIEKHRVDVVMAIPAMMELLFLRVDLSQRDISSVRKVVMGGSVVPNRLVLECAKAFNSRVYVGYGLTECPGFCVITSSGDDVAELGPYVGRATVGYEMSVRDDGGRAVGPNESGEVCLRSHYAMLEYLHNPEATAAVLDAEGWFHTGDLGFLSPDGKLTIHGRKKEMYIRGGFNVYPREVEDAIGSHAGVSQVAIHSIPDAVLGERGYGWVVREPGSDVSEEEIRQHLAEQLAYYKAPDVLRFVNELPMNAIGKTDKKALLERLKDEGIVKDSSRSSAT
jgi:acyl-CoA synthetase (AMP-forming)/AMP-acid ligase II